MELLIKIAVMDRRTRIQVNNEMFLINLITNTVERLCRVIKFPQYRVADCFVISAVTLTNTVEFTKV